MERELFGKKLAELRKNKGLTQKELADCLHVTDKAVSKWERGINFPDITLLQPLAQCLGVSAALLLTDEATAAEQPTALVESCVALANETTRREKWRSFWKGMVLPWVFILLNIVFLSSSYHRTLQNMSARAVVFFDSPASVVQKLGNGLDLSFASSSSYFAATGETLFLDFHTKYLCGSDRPQTFELLDGEIRVKTERKSGEVKLILLDKNNELCYFEPLEPGETVIRLPNGTYQMSLCGYWFKGDVHIDVNDRQDASSGV